MIPAPVIGDPERVALFSIESNTGFRRQPIESRSDIDAAAAALGLGHLSNVHSIDKPSATSLLFEADSDAAGRVILRKTDFGGAGSLAAQCAVAARIRPDLFIRPLAAGDGSHVVRAAEAAWIAYPRIAGDMYDGSNCRADDLHDAVFAFEDAVSATEAALEPAERAALPRVAHRTGEWLPFYEMLCADRDPGLGALRAELGGTTQKLLRDNGPFFIETARRAAALATQGQPALVHNDLNHANVLVAANGIAFLDLEDIVYELSEVALAHALFKLLRHRVFAGHADAGECSAALPALISHLSSEGYSIRDRATMFDFGALRILSDIHTICRYVLDRDDRSLVYDLEKKIHNLFELWIITEPTHEFAAG